MNIEEYFDKIKSIQSEFLEFLEFIENDENVEGNFQKLLLILEDKKIRDNKHDLRLFLHHVASICANHRRGKNFFAKIERVIQIFKSEISKYYINSEIFSIFKRDKRILLFLIEEKILIFDEYVARKMINEKYVKKKYPQYFAPEISVFKDQNWFPKHGDDSKNEWIDEINKKLHDRFHELRKIGENEKYFCELIRNDNVIDFATWVCRSNFPLESQIELSIYETNSFLLKDHNKSGRNKNSESSITLMEYAAFFGSTKIIKYLQMEGMEMTPSLCLYSIHSQNVRLIHFLEDCQVEQKVTAGGAEEESYKVLFWESIKCNHNRIADYFLNNYIQNGDQISSEIFIRSLKYYNFRFLQKEPVNESSFCRLCTHDYYLYVDDLLKNNGININSKIIRNHIFQYYSKSYLLMKLKIIPFNYIQNHIFQ